MKNISLNNEYQDDEIDLIELLRTLYSSKKLIILITLASALLAFAYLSQKEAEYQSTVILEVGSYNLINGEKKLVEKPSSLIDKLKLIQIPQQLNKLNFNTIGGEFLEIKYTSPLSKFNENLINEALIFSQESHAEILASIVSLISKKIMVKDIHELELKSNAEGAFTPEGLFILRQQKDDLKLQLKLLDNPTNMPQPIRELVTSEIKPRQLLTILIGTILGFIFSVFIVFIRQAFLKEQN